MSTALPPDRAVDRVAAWLRSHPAVVDAALGVLTALVSVPMARTGIDVALGVVAAAALIGRRVRPVASAVVVALAAVVDVVAMQTPAVVLPAVLITGYSLAAYGPRWAGPTAAGTTVLGGGLLVLLPVMDGQEVGPLVVQSVLGVGAVLAITVWLGGALRRAAGRNVQHLREHARLLEAQQAQQARLAALAERDRIAREMHDIVAHSLSVIIVQADGGRIAATHEGFGATETAASVFGDIAGAGRSALADIRTLLGLLHADDGDLPDQEGAPPQPGVDEIPALVEGFARAGMHVSLSVSGEPRELPAGTALTTYRVVQEALTNTLKHAGTGTRAAVELSWHADHLALHVTDEGPAPASSIPASDGSLGGRGLRGMRERVAAHGGSIDAGPRPERGFGVHLHLPYPPPAAGVSLT